MQLLFCGVATSRNFFQDSTQHLCAVPTKLFPLGVLLEYKWHSYLYYNNTFVESETK